jgi:REP element-mobilizing transposase RayT
MKYNPDIHYRRSIRLPEYDYSQEGLYFVTICCQDKICRFGKIMDGEIVLNDMGKIIKTEWDNLSKKYPDVELHEDVIMPNHFHAIIEFTTDNVGAGFA